MLEVLSAVTGESIAVFEDDEIADASVKALKQRLAPKIGLPRFRLRLLQDSCPLGDDQTFAMQVVQLVILEFLPPDAEQDQVIMVACEENDDTLLEQQLNQPRNPNFTDAMNAWTPLLVAARNGSLKCVLFLLEAGANKDQALTSSGATPLYFAAQDGHLEVVRFLVVSGASKNQGTKYDGKTPLFIAAQQGHLEVVRFLIESGANKDQAMTSTRATPLYVATQGGHLEIVRLLGGARSHRQVTGWRGKKNTRVFGYEHFLKHGSGPAKKGMGFLFCFTSKKKYFPLKIPNISPVVPRFLCLKLCKTLGRRVLVSPILK